MLQHFTLQNTTQDPAVLPFSHAVRAGDFLFVSGQLSGDVLWAEEGQPVFEEGKKEPIDIQAKKVMENLKTILEHAGTGFDRVVMARIFLRDFRDYDVVNSIYTSYLSPGRLPCRTTVGVLGLANQDDLEIDLIVYCGDSKL